jgi:hypothetical protein
VLPLFTLLQLTGTLPEYLARLPRLTGQCQFTRGTLNRSSVQTLIRLYTCCCGLPQQFITYMQSTVLELLTVLVLS